MKVTPTLLVLIAASSALKAQEPTASGAPAMRANAPSGYHFAGIAWGSGADSVKAALAREGLRFLGNDSLGDLMFTGKIVQRNAAVVASMHDGRAVRIIVAFDKAPRSTLSLYRFVKRELVSKYGAPKSSTEVFLPPARDGDGNEDSAFVTKKAAFLSQWETGTPMEKLSLLIDERPTVMLFYQSPEWPAEQARRAKPAP